MDIKVEISPSKKIVLFASVKVLNKSNEKNFLFHLKISFGFQDILIFALDFWLFRKNCNIRKIRLISKFMTSQAGVNKQLQYIYCPISYEIKTTEQ